MTVPTRPLSDSIRIRAGFTRSINLARDQDSIELLRTYVPTSRALVALEQMLASLSHEPVGRALALIGPYGSGKSALGLFAGALLGSPKTRTHQAAMATLQRFEPELAARAAACLAGTHGMLKVQVNGIPDSLVRQLMLALRSAVAQAGLAQTLVNRIDGAARPGVRLDHVLGLVTQAQAAWARVGGTGVLLEIDELGKFLEFEAYNPQHREVHLLQLLAEKAGEGGPAPLSLLVMLHQAFEHYSNRLGKSLRDEWKKVQGRFAAIAFLEPAEQSLRVVAASFERDHTLSPGVKADIFETAAELAQGSALPLGIDLSRSIELFQACYPLHPITLLILPVLCQKVAQNERTLFSYLGSTEPFGLRRRLDGLVMGDWIGPWDLYDYFILNQTGGFADPLTYHRWVEIITALERYDGDTSAGSPDPSARILKTIGLLNLIGAQRGLKATKAILGLLFPAELDDRLMLLQAASIIHFRTFAQEYRVWQGSDFDLHGALQKETAEQSSKPLADTLNALKPLPPLVARRASIETGTLRRFEPVFASAGRWPPMAGDVELPLWIYLAEPEETPDLSKVDPRAVTAVCRFSERLLEVVSEWKALQELPLKHAPLQQDPVAQREHLAWLSNAETDALTTIRSLLEAPELLTWYFGGQREPIADRRKLQQALSQWAQERCFPKSPRIPNELINRDRPSAAASTGRKKLLAAMLKASELEGLGIEKAPAERSLYLSLLHESGLHRPGPHGRWDFFDPPSNDPCRLRPLWTAVSDILGGRGERQVTLMEVYARLQQPPFGVRLGVLPILIIAYLLANRREVALYQEGVFCDSLTIEQAELLCRRPALFALERFAIAGLRGDLFERYLGSIVGNLREDATLLDIVRPLIRFAGKLPEYTQHCTGLSAEAERVRAAFRQAKSPGLLLFDALPRACGIDPESFNGQGGAAVEQFITRLIGVLRELTAAYPRLLAQWHGHLQRHLLDGPRADLAELRDALARRYQGLDRYAPQQGTVGAFIRRLSDSHFDTDQAWLESVMTLLGNAPPAKWRESHRVHAELRALELAIHLRELEQLCQAVPEASAEGLNGDAAILVKLVESARGEVTRVVRLSSHQRQAADRAAERIAADMSTLDDAMQVAVVAALLKRLTPPDPIGDNSHV